MTLGIVGDSKAAEALIGSFNGGLIAFKDILNYPESNAGSIDVIFVTNNVVLKEGKPNIDDVKAMLTLLAQWKFQGVVAITSSLGVGQCDQLQEEFKDLKLVHFPMFLDPRDPVKSFIQQKTICLSGKKENREKVLQALQLSYSQIANCLFSEKFKVTEFAKQAQSYLVNTQLQAKMQIRLMTQDEETYNAVMTMVSQFPNQTDAGVVVEAQKEVKQNVRKAKKEVTKKAKSTKAAKKHTPDVPRDAGSSYPKNKQVRGKASKSTVKKGNSGANKARSLEVVK